MALSQAPAPTMTIVSILPLPSPIQAPSYPASPSNGFQAAKYFTIIFFVASVSIVIIIALCMFCRCCGQMRSVVQPLGPNLPAGGRLRRRHLNMVQPAEPAREIITKKGFIVTHPTGDTELALRDLSCASMKPAPLGKESLSYTTVDMPSDIVIIPVAPLAPAQHPSETWSAQHPADLAPAAVWETPVRMPQSRAAHIDTGDQAQEPTILNTAAIAGILDTAASLPSAEEMHQAHPPSPAPARTGCISADADPTSLRHAADHSHSPRELSTAPSTQGLLAPEQQGVVSALQREGNSITNWRRGPEQLQESLVSEPAVAQHELVQSTPGRIQEAGVPSPAIRPSSGPGGSPEIGILGSQPLFQPWTLLSAEPNSNAQGPVGNHDPSPQAVEAADQGLHQILGPVQGGLGDVERCLHDTSSRLLDTQYGILDTATSIQGLLSTRQHTEMDRWQGDAEHGPA